MQPNKTRTLRNNFFYAVEKDFLYHNRSVSDLLGRTFPPPFLRAFSHAIPRPNPDHFALLCGLALTIPQNRAEKSGKDAGSHGSSV